MVITIERDNTDNLIGWLRNALRVILVISVIAEIILFPTVSNIVGCLMMIVCYLFFSNLCLQRHYINDYPLCFLMLLSMFLYRYLPVPSTLLCFKEVTWGMANPCITFVYETILFLVCGMAFLFACNHADYNNRLQGVFGQAGLYDYASKATYWVVGMIGFLANIITLAMSRAGEAYFGKGFFTTLVEFSYIPVILFFPYFYRGDKEKPVNFAQPILWIYLIVLSVVNLASNSREAIIQPFIMLALMYVMYLIAENKKSEVIMNPLKIIPLLLAVALLYQGASTVSNAMLAVRSVRADYTYTELIKLTWDEITSGDLIDSFESSSDNEPSTYKNGWDEEYIDNFLLNRYANIRISDGTLYFVRNTSKTNLGNEMREDFIDRLICILPQPIINALGLDVNKSDYNYSRGDYLAYLTTGNSSKLGGQRVTSHLADGLATFGVFYFVIQFLVTYLMFKMLKSLTYYNVETEKVIITPYTALQFYAAFALFQNSSGIYSDFSYILRTYWQNAILFIIIFAVAKVFSHSPREEVYYEE